VAAAQPAAAQAAPAPQQPTPAATEKKPTAEDPQQLEQAVRVLTERPAGSDISEAERQKLVELIQAAIQAQIEANAQQSPTPEPSKPTPPAPAPAQEARAAQTPTSQAVAQAQNKGCGGPTEPGPTLDLTPAPLDAPQPKYVCKEPSKTNKSAWVGQSAEFEFEIANEGAAPLAIRLKGG